MCSYVSSGGLGIDEWLVRLIQRMYENARSRVRIGCNLSEEFSVKVGVHQGFNLSPLLFIAVLEARSQEFHTGCLWQNCMRITWSSSLTRWRNYKRRWSSGRPTRKERDFRSTWEKANVLISGPGLDVLQKSGKDPCGVCLKVVGTNSIFCGRCSTRNAVASLAVWSLMPASGVNGALGRPNQLMAD